MILTKNYPATRNLNVLFNDFFNTFPSNLQNDGRNNAAPVNIVENDLGYELSFNVPGRNKEDFSINIEKDLLTVSYEKTEQKENTEQKFVRKEFGFQNFKRSFSLDEKINAEGIEAKYENGILKVFLPKKEDVKIAPKQISIQ